MAWMIRWRGSLEVGRLAEAEVAFDGGEAGAEAGVIGPAGGGNYVPIEADGLRVTLSL